MSDYSQMFNELCLMVEFAIEEADIELLKGLMEDDEDALERFMEWKEDHEQFGVGA